MTDWIAVDWGTTRLRAWGMRADGEVLWSETADTGMGGLTPDGFEPALLACVGPHMPQRRTRVLACGMVGARTGWAEAPYRAVPCAPLAEGPVRAAAIDPRLDVVILPGLKQTTPPDVMRGEETQIAGFLALNPGFDGVLCLPGSHTKWAEISAGEVVSFRTYMTGELFAALTDHSVLRHTLSGEGWNDAAFAEGVAAGLERPEQIAARLFGLRAGALLNGADPADGRARLSGLLIGIELAGARAYWLGREIAVIGAPALARHYVAALAQQAAPATIAEGDTMVLKGLAAAWRGMAEVVGS